MARRPIKERPRSLLLTLMQVINNYSRCKTENKLPGKTFILESISSVGHRRWEDRIYFKVTLDPAPRLPRPSYQESLNTFAVFRNVSIETPYKLIVREAAVVEGILGLSAATQIMQPLYVIG